MTRTPDEHDPARPVPHDGPRPARPGDAARPAGDAAASAGDPAGALPHGFDRLLNALGETAPRAAANTPGARTAPDAAPAPVLDELALRRLLHDAVREVEPRADTLDRLNRAIPARRSRRRQAMVGAAAGVLLVGTAVPAVLHAAQPDSADTARNINAASGLTPGGSAVTSGGLPSPGAAPGPAGQAPVPGGSTAPGVATPQASAPGVIAQPTTGGGSLLDTPACSRTQLGQGSAVTDAPDADGRVYGTFRVVNVSSQSCTVTGPSEISVTAQGDTNPSQIQVVDHTEGDPAAELPNPAEEPAAVILPPGQAYQVQFAWIPASGGGPSGCSAEASTPPPATDDGGTDDGGTEATVGGSDDGATGDTDSTDSPAGGPSADTAAMTDDDSGGTGGTPSGDGGTASPAPTDDGTGDGIALANTPPEGGPAAASTDISGACAGTVYQTDPMPTP